MAPITAQASPQVTALEVQEFKREGIPSPSATPRHNLLIGRLTCQLLSYFRHSKLGFPLNSVDCHLSQHTVLRPDIAIFLSPSAKQIDLDLAPVPFPPEIAVEILSPADKAVQINRKLRHYLAAGTQEVWIFDPANAEVFLHTPYSIRLLDGTMLLETPLLPGFRPSVAEILAPPTP